MNEKPYHSRLWTLYRRLREDPYGMWEMVGFYTDAGSVWNEMQLQMMEQQYSGAHYEYKAVRSDA